MRKVKREYRGRAYLSCGHTVRGNKLSTWTVCPKCSGPDRVPTPADGTQVDMYQLVYGYRKDGK